VVGALFLVYEALRRSRRNDFPFQFEPLFLHGILLVVVGLVAVFMIKVAWGGGRVTSVVAALLLGAPSAVLAFASYSIVVLDWSFVPERLAGEGFHQMGMVGLGAALAVLIGGWNRLGPAANGQ
jgi:RsiW-degrading membrane proteinase PrsW (M82 family)